MTQSTGKGSAPNDQQIDPENPMASVSEHDAETRERAVSVLIISYFTGPLLVRSVRSALAQPEVAEVIVIDNGNWAGQMSRLRALVGAQGMRLKILSGHGNVGYAAGCNLGARTAKGEFLFILNPDAVLPEGAVGSLLAETCEMTGDWLVGGRLVNPDGTEQAGSRRSPLTPWTAFVELSKLYKLAPNHPYFQRFNRHQDPCPADTVKTPVISGACMLLKRKTYQMLGGMDEGYFLHVEDVDFCLRLRKAGGDVYFAPGTDIVHFKSSSRVSKITVERRKAQSLVRYFWSHFREPYPAIFLALVSGLVWLSFTAKVVLISGRRAFSLIGFGARQGRRGLRKANAASKRRSR